MFHFSREFMREKNSYLIGRTIIFKHNCDVTSLYYPITGLCNQDRDLNTPLIAAGAI